MIGFILADAQPKPDASMVFLGILEQNQPKALRNPSEYALEDGCLYKTTDYRIGNTFIYHPNSKFLAPFVDKVVVLQGKMDKDLNQIIQKIGQTPENYAQEESMMQIRSDWVGPETGFKIGHSTKAKLKALNFFRCYSLQEYPGWKYRQQQGQISIEFTNLLNQTMQEIQFIGHYESDKGKPSPYYLTQQVSQFRPQQSISLEFAGWIQLGSKIYEFKEIQVMGEAKLAKIELQQPIPIEREEE